jgi:2-hydroxy-3-oxopropionate reductase
MMAERGTFWTPSQVYPQCMIDLGWADADLQGQCDNVRAMLPVAQKAGVDPARVVEAIKGGAAQMWSLDVKPPRLFTGNRQPGFKAYMQHKDLGIVLDTGKTYGIPLPLTAAIQQLYTAMLQNGEGELDNSAIIGVYERLANVKLDEKKSDEG